MSDNSNEKIANNEIPELCQQCYWVNRCDHNNDDLTDCFIPKEDIKQ